MKNASLVVVAVALLVGGCLREEVLPELVMVDGFADQPAALKFVDFPNEELALSAAREGIGLHLETDALIQEDVRLGWLVRIRELKDESLGYYIVRPQGPLNAAAKIFIDWLKAEVAPG